MFWRSRVAMDEKLETRSSKLGVEWQNSKFQTGSDPPAEFRISSFGFRNRVWRWIVGLGAPLTFIANPGLLCAQGCSMCYTTAAAAKQAAIQALRSGILILLIPPVLITMGIFAVALHRRDRFNDDNLEEPQADRELSELIARMSCEGVDVSRVDASAPAHASPDDAATIRAIPRSNS